MTAYSSAGATPGNSAPDPVQTTELNREPPSASRISRATSSAPCASVTGIPSSVELSRVSSSWPVVLSTSATHTPSAGSPVRARFTTAVTPAPPGDERATASMAPAMSSTLVIRYQGGVDGPGVKACAR
ncbi:Uncharacterised protein [Mycobacteroides abscessus subsp. abscessus]|nr:Uncharacterised protein [Mycobacteroides abscessus subsp. abscessus]